MYTLNVSAHIYMCQVHTMCMHVCIHLYLYVCAHFHVYTCVHTHICECVYLCKGAYMCAQGCMSILTAMFLGSHLN